MADYLIREATEADIAAITRLANSYVFEKLTPADRAGGFLTGRFELTSMQKMVNSATSLVAFYQQELVGFVINSKLPLAEYPPLVQTMALQFSEINYQNRPLTSYPYFFYGPVLVSNSHRGKGLLPRMVSQTKKLLGGKYELGLAFIHAQNQNSLKIHTQSLGMEVAGQFSFNKHEYYILIFPV